MSKVILRWDQVYLFLTSVFDENFKFCFQKYQFDILEINLFELGKPRTSQKTENNKMRIWNWNGFLSKSLLMKFRPVLPNADVKGSFKKFSTESADWFLELNKSINWKSRILFKWIKVTKKCFATTETLIKYRKGYRQRQDSFICKTICSPVPTNWNHL